MLFVHKTVLAFRLIILKPPRNFNIRNAFIIQIRDIELVSCAGKKSLNYKI